MEDVLAAVARSIAALAGKLDDLNAKVEAQNAPGPRAWRASSRR